MSTEFLYREKDGGACGWEAYSLFTPGSFGGGPWALRPKRLQWLTNITAGFKIAAFRKWVWQVLVLASQLLSIVFPAKTGIWVFFNENRDARLRGHDGKKACAISSKANHTSPAFAPILHHPQNSDRRKAWQKLPLHSFPMRDSDAQLS